MRIIGYLIALVALGWMVHRFDSSPAEWMATLWSSSPWLLAGALSCFVGQTLLNARAFCCYVSSEDLSAVPSKIRHAWRDSLLAKYLPGGIWQIASRWLLLERAGISRGLIIQASLFEQGLALGLCGLLGGFFWLAEYIWRVAPVPFFLGLLAMFSLGWVLVRLMCKMAAKLAPSALGRLGVAVPAVNPRALSGMATTMLAAMVPFALGYVLIFMPMLHSMGGLLRLLTTIFVATWVGLAVLFVPGGLGVRESAFPVLLAMHSLDASKVLSLAVVARIVLLLAEVVVFALMGRLRAGRK